MLLILLKGCFVEYKTGDSEEENEQLFLFHNHNRIMKSGYLESFVQTCALVSHWHNSSNSHWHNLSTVTGAIVQQFKIMCKSRWQDCSTVASTILQQLLVPLFDSHWHDSSTVAGTILQQSWAKFFLFSMPAESFNSDVHC